MMGFQFFSGCWWVWLVLVGCQVGLIVGTFKIWSVPDLFSNRNIVFDDPKEFDDPQVSDSLKVISSECVEFDDPKEFNDPQVFDDPKGISIGSLDIDNPRVCGDITIFDGLVLL